MCSFMLGLAMPTFLTGACENYMADIVFVIDSSGSIRDANPKDKSYDNWELLLNFMVTMVDKLNIGLNQVRIGVVKFSTDAESVFHLNKYTDKNSLKAAIRGISYLGGHTNTAGGIRIMHDVEFTSQNGDRPGVPNIAIVVADGVSTRDEANTIPEAIRARSDRIKIYSVGITSGVKEAELRDISSSPHEKDKNYFMAPNFQNLDRVAVAITSDACDNGKYSTVTVQHVEVLCLDKYGRYALAKAVLISLMLLVVMVSICYLLVTITLLPWFMSSVCCSTCLRCCVFIVLFSVFIANCF